MSKSYQRGNFLVDEIDLQAKLLQNKIGEVIQDEFVKEINRLVNEGARSCCEGCEVDDLSQLQHECMMTDQEELWLLHYQKAKQAIKLDKLWKGIQTAVMDRLWVHVEDSWLKYLLYIFKVDETSAFLMYKDFERRQDECEDECLSRGCYDYL